MSDAKDRFRKLRGHREMKFLMTALEAPANRSAGQRKKSRVVSRQSSRHPAAFNSDRDIAVLRSVEGQRGATAGHWRIWDLSQGNPSD